jgi:hypothetical protein
MKKFFYPFVIIFAIFLLGFVAQHQFRTSLKSFSEIKEKNWLDLKNFRMPPLEEFLSPKDLKLNEFISQDGKLKFKYLSDWVKIDERIKGALTQNLSLPQGDILFFAQKIKLKEGAIGFLLVEELNSEGEKNIEATIEKIKEGVESNKGKLEIINLAEEGIFEGRVTREKGGAEFHFKMRIVPSLEKVYLIDIFSLEKNWNDFSKEAEEIFSSVEVII